MISKGWLLSICITMVFTEISSQSCSQFRSWLQKMNKDNLALLNSTLGSIISPQCIDDVLNSPNYGSLRNIDVSDTENAMVALLEILQQMGHILKQNLTHLSWDENSIRGFQTRLDQQAQNLEKCLRVFPRSQRMQLTRLRVKRYFQRLRDLLKEKEYSRCAWEVVWIQVKQCFVQVNQLLQRIPNEA